MNDKYRLVIAGMFCLSASLYASLSQAEVPVIDESYRMSGSQAPSASQSQASSDSDVEDADGDEVTVSAAPVAPLSLPQRVSRLEKQVQSRSSDEATAQMEAMREELAALRDRVEKDNHIIQQLTQKTGVSTPATTNGVTASSASKAAVPGAAVSTATAAITEAAASGSSNNQATASQSTTEDPAELQAYQKGYDAIKAKDFERARKAFTSYLDTYSDGSYAGNAHYWLGEIYLHQNAYAKAANEFEAVISDSKNSKYPDAMLKLGLVYSQQGNYPAARKQFMQVKQKFAGSTEATLADTKLQEMTQQGY